ncbi:MAG: hypothetical protein K8953_11715, partial [Proteobacteria bacterium]|nr:hypothetical protein [Pseudomonadota bacterium]
MQGSEIILMKDQRAMLIKADTDELRNRIAHVAPGTGYMNYQDRATFAVVPFNETSTVGLRGIGIEAPSPIMHLYDWPRMDKVKITPTPQQKLTSEFLTLHRRGVVLNGMGTGKTFASLWACDYMLRMGIETRPWLILAPKSTLEVVWLKHLAQNFPYWKVKVLNGTNKRRLKRLGEDAMFYIINHEGFCTIEEDLYEKFGGVLVDEADFFRNPDTKTLYQPLNRWRVAHPDIRVWPMTGTPIPRAPTDAWVLGRLIDNPQTPLSWYAFRERTMKPNGPYASDWEPRDDALEKVDEILKPSI